MNIYFISLNTHLSNTRISIAALTGSYFMLDVRRYQNLAASGDQVINNWFTLHLKFTASYQRGRVEYHFHKAV